MKAVIQRVSHASVTVDGSVTGKTGKGLLVLLGVGPEDNEEKCAQLAGKISRLRIFEDEDGKMNKSVLDIGGGVLAVSQFTLYGDCRKGNRPSFVGAAKPDMAEPLYEKFCEELEKLGLPVGRGVFGAHMDVELLNDGPVTLILEM